MKIKLYLRQFSNFWQKIKGEAKSMLNFKHKVLILWKGGPLVYESQ